MNEEANVGGYHYVECGLPNVYLKNGFELVESPYGAGVSIRDIDGLHLCLARSLCYKPESLTGAEFRFLRRELDFSQNMMGELLGIGARQIRNIERGADPVGEPYNKLIRHMYRAARIDPNESYIALFEKLRSIDVEWHEELTLSRADDEDWSSNIREAA